MAGAIMAGAVGTASRRGHRAIFSGGGSRDSGLRLLASFPDVDRKDADPAPTVTRPPAVDEQRPRIGWGSIAILAAVALAACTAAWSVDTGPIDPGAAEIERVRIAERTDIPTGSRGRTKKTLKSKTTLR